MNWSSDGVVTLGRPDPDLDTTDPVSIKQFLLFDAEKAPLA